MKVKGMHRRTILADAVWTNAHGMRHSVTLWSSGRIKIDDRIGCVPIDMVSLMADGIRELDGANCSAGQLTDSQADTLELLSSYIGGL